MIIVKNFILTLICILLLSCSKKEEPVSEPEKESNEIVEEDSDSALTLEEAFSSNLVEGILGDENEVDLQLYLEQEIYPMVSKSNKITLDRISSSLFLLTYENNGAIKNLLIQKFYNPSTDEFVFDRRDTETNSIKQFLK